MHDACSMFIASKNPRALSFATVIRALRACAVPAQSAIASASAKYGSYMWNRSIGCCTSCYRRLYVYNLVCVHVHVLLGAGRVVRLASHAWSRDDDVTHVPYVPASLRT